VLYPHVVRIIHIDDNSIIHITGRSHSHAWLDRDAHICHSSTDEVMRYIRIQCVGKQIRRCMGHTLQSSWCWHHWRSNCATYMCQIVNTYNCASKYRGSAKLTTVLSFITRKKKTVHSFFKCKQGLVTSCNHRSWCTTVSRRRRTAVLVPCMNVRIFRKKTGAGLEEHHVKVFAIC